MPLMQFSTLVLPAPLGPISASSSARSTPNETRSSTVRPPKRKHSSSISSSAIPAPVTTVLLDGAIAAARAPARLAEVELLDVGMVAQARGITIEHDATVLQYIAVIDNLQRHGGALLHDHHGQRQLAADLDQLPHDVVDDHRRETQRQLIDEEQLGPADERAGDRQHLPFAARQEARRALTQIGEAREELINLGLAAALLGAADARGHGHEQILGHRQVGKHLLALRHQRDAELGIGVGLAVLDALLLESNGAFRDLGVVEAVEAGDGAQQGRFAGAIGAEDADDLSRRHSQRDALHRGYGALIDDLELVD